MPGGIAEGHRELCAQRFSKSHSHTSQTTNQDPQHRLEELHGLREQEGERRVGNVRPSGRLLCGLRHNLPSLGLASHSGMPWTSGLGF